MRPLRLARLATELSLEPDAETERLTRAHAKRVPETSPERVWAELRRLVIAERVLDGLALADRLGLTEAVLPELAGLRGVEQSHFHHLDVHDHTLEVLREQLELEKDLDRVFGPLAPRVQAVLDEPLADELTRMQALRFAALVHDMAKPATRRELPDGRISFIGHDTVGEELVIGLCRRLRTSERLASFLGGVTRHHLVLGFLVHERPLDRRAVYRYLRACEPVEIEVTVLSCADRRATRGRNAEAAIASHLDLAREVMGPALEWRSEGPPKPPLRGDDLARELGIERGPELGRLLEAIREAVFAGDVQDRDQAVGYARASAAPRDMRTRDDRRLRRLRAGRALATSRSEARERRLAHRDGAFVWIGLHEPIPRSSRPSAASSTCTSWPSRTRSRPTSARSSSATAT